MKKILVSGCGGSASTNFIRSLRLMDERIFIIGTDMNKHFLHLSEADENRIVPSISDPSYLEVMNKIIEDNGIEFVHCQPDPELIYLSESRDKLKAKMFIPRKSIIETAFDKMALNQLLRMRNVPHPLSCAITNQQDIKTALKYFRQNKHDKFWVRASKGAGSYAALPVIDYSQAKMWIDYWCKMKGMEYSNFMISEFLPGREFAFQSLWHNGELVTSQARERLAYVFGSRMPSGQSSSPTIARTVSDAAVNQVATQGIYALDDKPHGVYCVDMKENIKGVPCITEINVGRFFTTSYFFSYAGCNMPYYYVKLAYNEELPELKPYNPLESDLYWIRQIDCREKLVRGG